MNIVHRGRVRAIRALSGRLAALLAALLIALLAVAPVGARSPESELEIDPDVWIVELADPATVEYRGEVRQTVAADGTGRAAKAFAPTAPSVTGAIRLEPEAPHVRQYAAFLDRQRKTVLARVAAALGREIDPRFVYRHLTNGFSAAMTADEARMLAGLPGVKSVRPNVVQHVHTDAGPQWIDAPAVWNGAAGAPSRGEGTVLGVVDTGVNWESIFFDTTNSSVPVSNPRGRFFGLCNDDTLDIPCNDKLIGVYDFTDEGTNGFDPDGHGSHVASTAVGLPQSFTLDFGTGPIDFSTSGVAPSASFIAYKACQAPEDDSDGGGFDCPVDMTAAALERALEDGVDVVNFSIGSPAFDPWSQAGNQHIFLNLRAAGIVPVVSAGNGGPDDASVSSPANTPWVVAVANASHGRILGTRLINVSGGPFALGILNGEALAEGTVTTRPIVHARDFGNALCGTGPAELGPGCDDNTGASNPFSPGTFNGEIVVCDRGEYGRVEKGRNLELAGAGGMILANTDDDGESTSGDEHCLPATHVGAGDGNRLRDWLATGDDHRGRLTGTQRIVDPDRSGRLAVSSGRGPAVGAPDVMKPNLTAPGTAVLAGSTETDAAGTGPGENAANQVALLTGTSMSSPHVAGAALLLRSLHPDWGANEVISALETTADAGIVRREDDSDARIIDRGAGGVQVDRAARVGLFLPVTEQDFLKANPSLTLGELDPGDLNLPGVVGDNCVQSCSFRRIVRALQAGSWSVTTEGSLAATVTPASFTLTAGQQRTLEIEIRRGDVAVGAWGAGSVVLTPNDNGLSVQRLPVGAFMAAGELPGQQDYTSPGNRGENELTIDALIAVDELVVGTSELKRPQQQRVTLRQDPTNEDPFDSDSGTATEFLDVPEGALLLHAEVLESGAEDIDLWVGRDDNGDGQAQRGELRCSSRSADETELCRIESPPAGNWWVRVQNWDGANTLTGDPVLFEFAAFAEADSPTLVTAAPGAHPGGSLTIPLYWDQPAMRRGQRWMGVVALSSNGTEAGSIGLVPISVTRNQPNAPAETALFNDRAETVVIPGETLHDRLYIDVPDGAESVAFEVRGATGEVTLRRRGFDELVSSVPRTPAAPTEVLSSGNRAGDVWTAGVSGTAGQGVPGGRYFVVIENDDPTESDFQVTATVFESAGVTTPRGLWGPESRAINQGLDWQISGSNSFLVWYTYDELRRPTFYITEAVPDSTESSFFAAKLFRVTSNDRRQTAKVVGEVQVTAIDPGRLMFAWRINGRRGAEMHAPIHDSSCPVIDGEPVQLLGHWISPDTSAGGVTLLKTGIAEAWIRYFYDTTDQPRWVITGDGLSRAPAAAGTLTGSHTVEVVEFRGWCIYCEEVPITSKVVGTLERVFLDRNTVREITDFVAGPPVDTAVANDREIVRLTNSPNCSNQ